MMITKSPKEMIEEVMKETGRLPQNGRIEIINWFNRPFSDLTTIEINCFKSPRCRKPSRCWKLTVNTVRMQILWDKSEHYAL